MATKGGRVEGAEPLLGQWHVAVSVVAFIGWFEKESERQWVCVNINHMLVLPLGSQRAPRWGSSPHKIASSVLEFPSPE